jgi:hypothetical protein
VSMLPKSLHDLTVEPFVGDEVQRLSSATG